MAGTHRFGKFCRSYTCADSVTDLRELASVLTVHSARAANKDTVVLD